VREQREGDKPSVEDGVHREHERDAKKSEEASGLGARLSGGGLRVHVDAADATGREQAEDSAERVDEEGAPRVPDLQLLADLLVCGRKKGAKESKADAAGEGGGGGMTRMEAL
jgi:hypothetical protein